MSAGPVGDGVTFALVLRASLTSVWAQEQARRSTAFDSNSWRSDHLVEPTSSLPGEMRHAVTRSL